MKSLICGFNSESATPKFKSGQQDKFKIWQISNNKGSPSAGRTYFKFSTHITHLSLQLISSYNHRYKHLSVVSQYIQQYF